MRLEVGKTYNHASSGEKDQYTITAQHGPELFEGKRTDGKIQQTRFFFNGSGHCIGVSNQGNSVSNFRLTDLPQYEVNFVHSNGRATNSWHRLSDCTAIWDNGNFYLVREVGNNASLQLMRYPEFDKLRNQAISSK